MLISDSGCVAISQKGVYNRILTFSLNFYSFTFMQKYTIKIRKLVLYINSVKNLPRDMFAAKRMADFFHFLRPIRKNF